MHASRALASALRARAMDRQPGADGRFETQTAYGRQERRNAAIQQQGIRYFVPVHEPAALPPGIETGVSVGAVRSNWGWRMMPRKPVVRFMQVFPCGRQQCRVRCTDTIRAREHCVVLRKQHRAPYCAGALSRSSGPFEWQPDRLPGPCTRKFDA
jgi:hypothetical protein